MNFKQIIFLCVLMSSSCHMLAQSSIVNAEPSLDDRFPKRIGGLRFSQTTLQLGTVFNNETRNDTIRLYNNSDQVLTLSPGANLPVYIKLQVVPGKLEPSQEGMLVISWSAAGRNEFGFVFDRILLNTNDPAQSVKNVNITATIKEFFPAMSAEDSILSARARIAETTFNFGRIQQGEKSHHDFLLYNDGKRNLLIHQAKTTCGCIKTGFSKKELAPADSVIISMEFDSFGKEGLISKEVSVFVSDPFLPEIHFSILAEVWK